MKKLAISIVTFNSEQVISKCISSIAKFLSPDFYTLYIYDNASTDSTIEAIKKFTDIDVKILPGKTNIGFGRAHNEILKQVLSPYILVLNPDTEFLDSELIAATKYLDEHNSVGLLTFKMLDSNQKLFYNCHRYPSLMNLILRRIPFSLFKSEQIKYSYMDIDHNKIFEVDWCSGAFLLIRSKLFKAKEFFDEKYFMYFEDVDLCKSVWNRNYKVIYYPNGKFFHHWKQESRQSFKLKKYLVISMLYYFKKWGFKLF